MPFLITTDLTPLFKTSGRKLCPSKFLPLIAIKRSLFNKVLLSILIFLNFTFYFFNNGIP